MLLRLEMPRPGWDLRNVRTRGFVPRAQREHSQDAPAVPQAYPSQLGRDCAGHKSHLVTHGGSFADAHRRSQVPSNPSRCDTISLGLDHAEKKGQRPSLHDPMVLPLLASSRCLELRRPIPELPPASPGSPLSPGATRKGHISLHLGLPSSSARLPVHTPPVPQPERCPGHIHGVSRMVL